MLDRELARQIRRESGGDGSWAARVAFVKRLRETCRDLPTPEIAHGALYPAMEKHGRVPVAICLAATIWLRRDCLDYRSVRWARAVLDEWTNRRVDYDVAYIHDEVLHPTEIDVYAGDFIRLTTEEAEM